MFGLFENYVHNDKLQTSSSIMFELVFLENNQLLHFRNYNRWIQIVLSRLTPRWPVLTSSPTREEFHHGWSGTRGGGTLTGSRKREMFLITHGTNRPSVRFCTHKLLPSFLYLSKGYSPPEIWILSLIICANY
jgi:hypothetical protein